MIKTNSLLELLNITSADTQKLNNDQLRVMLGSFRFVVRTLERELNNRFKDQPLGTNND